jgi:hypothetical protein
MNYKVLSFLHYFGISIQLKGHFSVDKCTIDPKNVQISLLELTKLQPNYIKD